MKDIKGMPVMERKGGLEGLTIARRWTSSQPEPTKQELCWFGFIHLAAVHGPTHLVFRISRRFGS